MVLDCIKLSEPKKTLRMLKNYQEKMSVRVSAHMSKIMHRPIKVRVGTDVSYTNCQTLDNYSQENTSKNYNYFYFALFNIPY